MKRSGLIALFVIAIQLSGSTLLAQRRGGGNYRSSAQTNVNRNANVNRNVNVNNNVNVNRNRQVPRCIPRVLPFVRHRYDVVVIHEAGSC